MINLALLLRRWERSVNFLPVDHFGFLAFGQCFRFISREKAFPIFISQFRIFGQLSFDHKCFDVVDWMNIFHGFFNYSSNLLQNEDGYKKIVLTKQNTKNTNLKSFMRSYGSNSVALNENVTIGQEFHSFQR